MLLRFFLAIRNAWIRATNALKQWRDRPVEWVYLDLQGPLTELPPPRPWWWYLLAQLRRQEDPHCSLVELRAQLEQVAEDPDARGVVIRWAAHPSGWATAGGARRALQRFQQQGKRVVVYAEELDGPGAYATGLADRLVLTPAGGWTCLGISAEAVFLKDALAKLGIAADVLAVSPYKTAGDALARAEMSAEHREMLDWLVEASYNELCGTIAADRRIDAAEVAAAMDRGPLSAAAAVAAGLADDMAYLDELPALLAGERPQARAEVVPLPAARRRLLRRPRTWSGAKIAIVRIEGMIVSGTSKRSPTPVPLPGLNGVQAGAESVAQALRQAEKDPRVRGAVILVDSPGGSALASDLMWREIRRLSLRMPVVAHMGDVAASGGYYVASGGRAILCQPGTVTGSIGVVMMKLVTGGMLDKAGVGRGTVSRGERARMFRPDAPFTDGEREGLTAMLDETYGRFQDRVREGRGDRLARPLEELAGGRVWLGSQAVESGLADAYGDLRDAMDRARELAGVDPDAWTPGTVISPRTTLLPGPLPAAESALRQLRRPGAWLLAPLGVRLR